MALSGNNCPAASTPGLQIEGTTLLVSHSVLRSRQDVMVESIPDVMGDSIQDVEGEYILNVLVV